MHEFIDSAITSITAFMGGNIFLAAIVAFAAGLLSSLSPCLMTTVPLIVGYIGSDREHNQKRRAVIYSLLFCAGVVTVFTLFGVISALLGNTLSEIGSWWSFVVAALLIVVALDLFDVVHLLHHHPKGDCVCGHEHHAAPEPHTNKKGGLGAFLLGLGGGVFTAPCATPALVVILALVSSEARLASGIFLLFFYAVGHCVLIMVAGCSTGLVNRISSSKGGGRLGRAARILFGIVLLALAAVVVYEAVLGH